MKQFKSYSLNRQTHGQTDRQMDRQTDGWTDRQTDGQTDTTENITYRHSRVVINAYVRPPNKTSFYYKKNADRSLGIFPGPNLFTPKVDSR